MTKANDEVLIIAQVETERGLANVEAIAATPGVDVIWIGQFDLSNFLGVPGDFDSATYKDAWAEITDAARQLARKAAAGEISPDDIDESLFADHLYTAGLPDPDLLIRTAGEMRLSNYLLWQLSYAEFYVTDVCWPDFTVAELHKALESFRGRTRRFGGVV